MESAKPQPGWFERQMPHWCMPFSHRKPDVTLFDLPVYFDAVHRQELSHMRMLALVEFANRSEIDGVAL